MNECVRGPLLMLDELDRPFDAEKLFGHKARLELEIGAGRGDFLLDYAPNKPDTDFIGVERKLVIARRAASKFERAGLKNAVMVQAEIAYLLQEYFPPHRLDAIHIYFPDPWPKRCHVKRRLFQGRNWTLILEALHPGGFLHFRTDVEWYFKEMLELAASFGKLMRVTIPPELSSAQTGFEKRFRMQGKEIFAASFQI